jgi:hypothetical protein
VRTRIVRSDRTDHFDNTHASKEESYDDGHEAVNLTENIDERESMHALSKGLTELELPLVTGRKYRLDHSREYIVECEVSLCRQRAHAGGSICSLGKV